MPKGFVEPFLLDTNVLVRAHQTDHSQHQAALELIKESLGAQQKVTVAQQNLVEFARVATDKRMMEFPLTPKQAGQTIAAYQQSGLKVIQPSAETIIVFVRLLSRFPRLRDSKQVFDIFLTATMLSNEVAVILTENVKDFRDIPGITAINPFV